MQKYKIRNNTLYRYTFDERHNMYTLNESLKVSDPFQKVFFTSKDQNIKLELVEVLSHFKLLNEQKLNAGLMEQIESGKVYQPFSLETLEELLNELIDSSVSKGIGVARMGYINKTNK